MHRCHLPVLAIALMVVPFLEACGSSAGATTPTDLAVDAVGDAPDATSPDVAEGDTRVDVTTDVTPTDVTPTDATTNDAPDASVDVVPTDAVEVAPDAACQVPEPYVDLAAPGDCNDVGWCRLAPQTAFVAAQGFASNDVWAVRDNAILHWDGAAWHEVFGGLGSYVAQDGSTVQGPPAFRALWGSSSSNLWFAGTDPSGRLTHFDGHAWTTVATPDPGLESGIRDIDALWGSGSDDIWAGGQGFLLHYDGCAWSLVPFDHAVSAIWGSGPADVWAVGGASLMRFDGTQWTGGDYAGTLPSPTASAGGVDLRSAWGTGPSDVWSAGTWLDGSIPYALVLHFDGLQWSPAWSSSNSFSEAWGVWGSQPDDVWAFGAMPALAHDVGGTWTPVTAPVVSSQYQKKFLAAWGAAGDDLWAFGDGGTIDHYDGGAWTTRNVANAVLDFTGIWGLASDDVLVGGTDSTGAHSVILRWNGNSLAPVTQMDKVGFGAMSGTGPNDVWLAASGGPVHFDGSAWTHAFLPADPVTGISSPLMYGVHADSDHNVWMVGQHGVIWRGQGSPVAWSYVANPLAAGFTKYQNLNAVWGNPGGLVWAVGDSHEKGGKNYFTILVGNMDNGNFQDVSVLDTANAKGALRAVFGVTPTNLWAGGDDVLLHLPALEWEAVPFPAGVHGTVNAIWGAAADDVWFSGATSDGHVLLMHWDGVSVKAVATPDAAATGTGAAMIGFGANDVFFAGHGGSLFHYQGVP